MPLYLQILANQEPFPIGSTDADKRARISCNYACMVDGEHNVEIDIKDLLVNRGLGVFATSGVVTPNSIFIGHKATIPTGDGPYILILATGGLGQLETHNYTKQTRPWVQIIVYATNYQLGMQKALAIKSAIGSLRNVRI